MSIAPGPKPLEEVTPRQLLDFNRLGTGCDLDREGYQAYLSEHGPYIVSLTRQLIEDLTGFQPTELHKIAPEVTSSRSSKAKQTRRKIIGQMVKKLPYVDKYKGDRKEDGLRELGGDADDYIRSLVAEYFPGQEAVKMHSRVETCSDAATLVLMAFNDRLAPKIKFEAARKLYLMKFFGELRDYSEKQVDHEKALQFMMDIFSDRILKPPLASRLGIVFDRCLVSHHDVEDFRTTFAELKECRPEDVPVSDDIVRVTHMPCQRAVIKNVSGQEREIFFSIQPREKTSGSRLTKTLRYNSMIGERDVDRNGFRLVFANRNDWEDFFRTFQEEMKRDIEENLQEQLADEPNQRHRKVIQSRLRSLDHSIIIHDVKDSLDGGEFQGGTESSSSALKIYKFKLEVTRADGRQHHYEFQIFLPDGYADSTYRKGVSWEEYNVDRFFRESVDELLFPKTIYPQIDREQTRANAMRMAHQKLWGSNKS